MKLSGRTIQILKNFSTINQSLWFKQGNVIKTAASLRTTMAKATVQEQFDMEFGIYDLSRFLGVLTLFNEPDVKVTPTHLVIDENGSKVNITHVSKEVIDRDVDSMYTKNIVLPSVDVSFQVTSEQLLALIKALSVLQLPHICVCGESGKLIVRATDCSNATANRYELDIGTTKEEFQVVFKSENMKMLQDTYTWNISFGGIGHFVSSDIEYWVAAESKLSKRG